MYTYMFLHNLEDANEMELQKKNGGVLKYLNTGTTLPYLYISIIQYVKRVNRGHRCSSIAWLVPYQQAVGW
jgi:hypothetical protein